MGSNIGQIGRRYPFSPGIGEDNRQTSNWLCVGKVILRETNREKKKNRPTKGYRKTWLQKHHWSPWIQPCLMPALSLSSLIILTTRTLFAKTSAGWVSAIEHKPKSNNFPTERPCVTVSHPMPKSNTSVTPNL